MAGSGTAHLREGARLRVERMVQEFVVPSGDRLRAVSDVSLDIMPGEILGLVGESGCGKSTLARSIMQEPRPKSGRVIVDSIDLTALRGRKLRAARRRLHMVFQDPYSSLNPRWSVARLVGEAVDERDASAKGRRVDEALEWVQLDPARYRDRRPHELSGGQCQRVAIARALASRSSVIIFDEAVSSLDVSTQAQVLNVLAKVHADTGYTALFVAHDLSVVKHVSDVIAVMYLGKLCEFGPAESVFTTPAHPYTLGLISAIPKLEADAPTGTAGRPRQAVAGDLPSPLNPPSGCRFRTRCPRVRDECAMTEPRLAPVGPNHFAACHFPATGTAAQEAASPNHGSPAGQAADQGSGPPTAGSG